ncbi:hypothetical protein Bhyg_11992, partial [Pseudolycoriella hygida]
GEAEEQANESPEKLLTKIESDFGATEECPKGDSIDHEIEPPEIPLENKTQCLEPDKCEKDESVGHFIESPKKPGKIQKDEAVVHENKSEKLATKGQSEDEIELENQENKATNHEIKSLEKVQAKRKSEWEVLGEGQGDEPLKNEIESPDERKSPCEVQKESKKCEVVNKEAERPEEPIAERKSQFEVKEESRKCEVVDKETERTEEPLAEIESQLETQSVSQKNEIINEEVISPGEPLAEKQSQFEVQEESQKCKVLDKESEPSEELLAENKSQFEAQAGSQQDEIVDQKSESQFEVQDESQKFIVLDKESEPSEELLAEKKSQFEAQAGSQKDEIVDQKSESPEKLLPEKKSEFEVQTECQKYEAEDAQAEPLEEPLGERKLKFEVQGGSQKGGIVDPEIESPEESLANKKSQGEVHANSQEVETPAERQLQREVPGENGKSVDHEVESSEELLTESKSQPQVPDESKKNEASGQEIDSLETPSIKRQSISEYEVRKESQGNESINKDIEPLENHLTKKESQLSPRNQSKNDELCESQSPEKRKSEVEVETVTHQIESEKSLGKSESPPEVPDESKDIHSPEESKEGKIVSEVPNKSVENKIELAEIPTNSKTGFEEENRKENNFNNVSDDIVLSSDQIASETPVGIEQKSTKSVDSNEHQKISNEDETRLTALKNAEEKLLPVQSRVSNFREPNTQSLHGKLQEIEFGNNTIVNEADSKITQSSSENKEDSSSHEKRFEVTEEIIQPKSQAQLFTVEKDGIYVNVDLLQEKFGPIAIDDGALSESEKSFNLNIQEREDILVNQENVQSKNYDESTKISVEQNKDIKMDETNASENNVEFKDQDGNEEYELAETVVLVDIPRKAKSNDDNEHPLLIDIESVDEVIVEGQCENIHENDLKKSEAERIKFYSEAILDNKSEKIDKTKEEANGEHSQETHLKTEPPDRKSDSNEALLEKGDQKDVEEEPKEDSTSEQVIDVHGIENSEAEQPQEQGKKDENKIICEAESNELITIDVEEQKNNQDALEQVKIVEKVDDLGKQVSEISIEVKEGNSDEILKSKENEDLIKAATTIQKIFRGYAVRKSVNYPQTGQLERSAALIIQKYIRGYLVRKHMQKLRKNNVISDKSGPANDDEKEAKTNEENANNEKVTQPPPYFNRFLIPKDSFLERESFADDEDYTRTCTELAATSIQKTYRGYRVRRSLKASSETDGASSNIEDKKESVGNDQVETVVNEADRVISAVLNVAADVLPLETYDNDSFENESAEEKDVAVKDLSSNHQIASDENSLKHESVLGKVVQDNIHVEGQMQQKFNQMSFQSNAIIPIEEMSDSSENPETPTEKTAQIDSSTKLMSGSVDSSQYDGLKSFSYEALSSDISDTDENKRGSMKDSEIDETSRDERDDLSEVENFDLSSCGEDSLEAMYYSIRKSEIMLDRMHKQVVEQREPKNAATENSKVEFPERVTENLDVTMQHVFKSLESSSDCDGGKKDEDGNSSTLDIEVDDSSSITDEKEIETSRQIKQIQEENTENEEKVESNIENPAKNDEGASLDINVSGDRTNNTEQSEQSDNSLKSSTRVIMKSQSVSEDMMNPIMFAMKRKQALLDQLHVRPHPLQENLSEDHDAFPEHLLSDIDIGNIQRKILASSMSTDSDYVEPSVISKRLVRDDFNISTALDHLSTDSDSTIVSAATKIQAGARGFLTRRRLRRASAGGTSISFEKRCSFGNAAIDKSLEDLIKRQEQIHLDGAALKIQQQYRKYQARKKNLKKVSPIREQTLESSGGSSTEVEGTDDNLGIREITLAQKKVDQQNDEEMKGTLQLNDDEVDSVRPVKRTPVNQRRFTLQRGDAVQRNSRPDSQELNTREPNHTNTDNQNERFRVKTKDNENGEFTITAKVKENNKQEKKVTSYINIQSLINRGIGPRQRSMPVQIDSELMRIIPKHLRKRVKSADMAKRKS